MNKQLKSADLFFKEGTSDKVYSAQVVQVSAKEAVVNFQFGRRGNTLNSNTKTPTPVPVAEAEEIFNELVASKVKKGYQPA